MNNICSPQRKNISIQTTSVFMMALLQLLSIIVLARVLTPLDFGKIAAASVIIALATMLSEIGIGSAIVQRKEISKRYISTAFNLSFILFIILAVLIYISAPFIAKYNNDISLVSIIRYLCIAFVFNGISSIPKGLLLRKLDYKGLMIVTVAPFFISVNIISTLLAIKGYGVWSLVIGQTINGIMVFILSMVKSKIHINFQWDNSHIKELAHFGGGITLSRIFNYLTVQGDKIILGNTIGLEVLGVFERLYKIVTLISSQIGSIFDSILFPIFSRIQDDKSSTNSLYYQSIWVASLIGLMFSLILPLFSYEITFLILGRQWIEYSYILQLLLFLPFMRLLTRVGDAVLRSFSMVYQSAFIKFCSAVITLSGLYFASKLDLFWLPFAYLVSSLFTAIALHILIIWKTKSNGIKVLSTVLVNFIRLGMLFFPIWIGIYFLKNQLNDLMIFSLKLVSLGIIFTIIIIWPKILGSKFLELTSSFRIFKK